MTFAETVQRLDFHNSFLFETSPALIDARITAFTCPAGRTIPIRVPVLPRPGAAEGWCFRNVAEIVAAEGGRPVLGWLTWVSAVAMTAEYHAVWAGPDGRIIDPTPKADGETFVVFGEDPDATGDFDFTKRPPARRMRTYQGRSRLDRARDAIGCFSPKEMASKRRRAQKGGKALDAWVADKLPEHDDLELAIDRYLACADAIERLLTPTSRGMMCSDLDAFDRLNEAKRRLWRRLDGIVERRRMLGLFAPTTTSSEA